MLQVSRYVHVAPHQMIRQCLFVFRVPIYAIESRGICSPVCIEHEPFLFFLIPNHSGISSAVIYGSWKRGLSAGPVILPFWENAIEGINTRKVIAMNRYGWMLMLFIDFLICQCFRCIYCRILLILIFQPSCKKKIIKLNNRIRYCHSPGISFLY